MTNPSLKYVRCLCHFLVSHHLLLRKLPLMIGPYWTERWTMCEVIYADRPPFQTCECYLFITDFGVNTFEATWQLSQLTATYALNPRLHHRTDMHQYLSFEQDFNNFVCPYHFFCLRLWLSTPWIRWHDIYCKMWSHALDAERPKVRFRCLGCLNFRLIMSMLMRRFSMSRSRICSMTSALQCIQGCRVHMQNIVSKQAKARHDWYICILKCNPSLQHLLQFKPFLCQWTYMAQISCLQSNWPESFQVPTTDNLSSLSLKSWLRNIQTSRRQESWMELAIKSYTNIIG